MTAAPTITAALRPPTTLLGMAGVIMTDMGGAILADARGLGGVRRYMRGPNEGKARAYSRRREMSRIVGVGAHHWGPPSPSLVPHPGESMVDAAVGFSFWWTSACST